ncbi:MAG: hypothetical protein IT379_01335 [Deltaproteobacteria bacterium]|nr:hypothetical protein [Deltaproteobacteria bacterium]
MRARGSWLAFGVLSLIACGDDDGSSMTAPDAASPQPPPPAVPPPPPAPGVLVHTFPAFEAAAGDEIFGPCQSWTLDNDEDLFVTAVHMLNDGGWHHSNWFFVPDDVYSADDGSNGDGTWGCEERGFDQALAASMGGVLFAQSTQAEDEEQRFPDGTAIRIPARSRIVGGIHVLNVSSADISTALTFEIETVARDEITIELAALALSNRALDLPPRTFSAFSMTCDLAAAHRRRTGRDLDYGIYYVLPHYHTLADGYRLEVVGGPRDGESVYGTGMDVGDPLGQSFATPFDLTGATGLRVTCTYFNPRDRRVGHGIGSQEMCDTLIYTDANHQYLGVSSDNVVGDTVDGVVQNEAGCEVFSFDTPE